MINTWIVEDTSAISFQEQLGSVLNKSLAGKVVMSILYSTSVDLNRLQTNRIRHSALIIYRDQEGSTDGSNADASDPAAST